MREHNRTDRLTMITILIVLVIGTVLLAYRTPRLNYASSPEEGLMALNEQDDYLRTTEELKDLKGNENIVLVDIRNSGDYFVSHIEEAVNIPMIKLLAPESIEIFEDDSKTYILYGENHRDANGPWMVLRQLGLDNVDLLLGGYQNYRSMGLPFPAHITSGEEVDMAKYDLSAQIDSIALRLAAADEEKAKEAQKVPVKMTRPVSVKKASPKPVIPVQEPEEEEEEEGC